MSKISISIIRLPHAPEELPAYATPGSAGLDLQAAIDVSIVLQPLQRALIPTGFIVIIPSGYEAQVRPRSGLAIKHGITLINAVGTIDSDYRQELCVPLVNLSQEAYTVQPGDRIAQLLVAELRTVVWHVCDHVCDDDVSLAATDALMRTGGFGSTGR